MQRKPPTWYVVGLAIATSLAAGISGCNNSKTDPQASPSASKLTQAKADQTVYKFQPTDYPASVGVSRNLKVEETKAGFAFEALEDSKSAMTMDLSGRIQKVFPDAPGSTNIHVKVNTAVGHTTLAGLRFSKACVINIRADGTVEVDSEGLEAETESGAKYISRRVADLGAIVMVEAKGGVKESPRK